MIFSLSFMNFMSFAGQIFWNEAYQWPSRISPHLLSMPVRISQQSIHWPFVAPLWRPLPCADTWEVRSCKLCRFKNPNCFVLSTSSFSKSNTCGSYGSVLAGTSNHSTHMIPKRYFFFGWRCQNTCHLVCLQATAFTLRITFIATLLHCSVLWRDIWSCLRWSVNFEGLVSCLCTNPSSVYLPTKIKICINLPTSSHFGPSSNQILPLHQVGLSVIFGVSRKNQATLPISIYLLYFLLVLQLPSDPLIVPWTEVCGSDPATALGTRSQVGGGAAWTLLKRKRWARK